MTKRRKVILTVVAAWVACGLGSTAVRCVSDYKASKIVAGAQQEASAAAPQVTTFVAARQWLEQHGYRVIVWDPYVPDGYVAGSYEDHAGGPGPRLQARIVVGEKVLRPASWSADPAWLDLTFQFSGDGLPAGVLAEKVRTAFPATRPAA